MGEGRTGGRRWVLVAALFVYSLIPLAWGLLAVQGTTPPLSGGGAGAAELGGYAADNLNDQLENLFGLFFGRVVLMSFYVAGVAAIVLFFWHKRQRREREIEEQLNQARNAIYARVNLDPELAILRGRTNVLEEIVLGVETAWPGPYLAGGTQAARTIRDCDFLTREASEMMEVAGRDRELLDRLGRVRDFADRYEREARSVAASLN